MPRLLLHLAPTAHRPLWSSLDAVLAADAGAALALDRWGASIGTWPVEWLDTVVPPGSGFWVWTGYLAVVLDRAERLQLEVLGAHSWRPVLAGELRALRAGRDPFGQPSLRIAGRPPEVARLRFLGMSAAHGPRRAPGELTAAERPHWLAGHDLGRRRLSPARAEAIGAVARFEIVDGGRS